MEFDVSGAKAAASANELEDWVLAYLAGPGENPEFVAGLELEPRYWRGPELVPVERLGRTVGPEAEMPFRVPDEYWAEATGCIADSFASLEAFPPLIAEYVDGELLVRDGNHRLGAFNRLGLESCWVVLWYANEAAFFHHRARAFQISAG